MRYQPCGSVRSSPTGPALPISIVSCHGNRTSWVIESKGPLCGQEPFQKALLAGKTAHAARRSKPSYYAVSTEDRTINPDLERFMGKRMGAKTIEVKASHLSPISHPEEITRLIFEAAGQQA
jgi:hypothetical protein